MQKRNQKMFFKNQLQFICIDSIFFRANFTMLFEINKSSFDRQDILSFFLPKLYFNVITKEKIFIFLLCGSGAAEAGAAVTAGEVRSGSPVSDSCPLCRRRDWRQLEGDIWRLDSWLTHAAHQLDILLEQVF